MATNFDIPENPEYIEAIRKFKAEDPAHAELFNAVIQVLINNDTWLKLLALRAISGVDAQYQQLTEYTNQEIAKLINGAPNTLNTLGKIANAMQENDSVVEVLEEAIGNRASAAEFDTYSKNTDKLLGNNDLSGIGDGTITGAIKAIWEALGTQVTYNINGGILEIIPKDQN